MHIKCPVCKKEFDTVVNGSRGTWSGRACSKRCARKWWTILKERKEQK